MFKSIIKVAALLAAVASVNARDVKRQTDLEAFIERQSQVSIDGVLANIGADGSQANDVPPGVVVASPSRSDPDCMCPFPQSRYPLTCTRLVHMDTRRCVDVQSARGTLHPRRC